MAAQKPKIAERLGRSVAAAQKIAVSAIIETMTISGKARVDAVCINQEFELLEGKHRR